jgi:hypothetical protein
VSAGIIGTALSVCSARFSVGCTLSALPEQPVRHEITAIASAVHIGKIRRRYFMVGIIGAFIMWSLL